MTTNRDFYQRFMAAAEERRQRALKLRGEGKTFEEIGQALGVTRQRAFKIVRRAKEVIPEGVG